MTPMTQGSLIERITRSLAYMLRHQPEEFDLELNAYGYGELGDVVCALNERLGEPIEEQDVLDAIESGDRPRYEVKDGMIRALYGHSISIDPGDPSDPPEELYLGVGSRDAERAAKQGLRGGRRTFLHLALTYDDARETGRRVAEEYAVITVFAQRAFEVGDELGDVAAIERRAGGDGRGGHLGGPLASLLSAGPGRRLDPPPAPAGSCALPLGAEYGQNGRRRTPLSRAPRREPPERRSGPPEI